MKILIVDDEEIKRISLFDSISDEGFTVEECGNPVLALDLLNKEKFDIVITDLKMPNINGLELLKEAKVIYPNCYVIVMTAYATVETAVEAMKQGAYDYFLKPFPNEKMIKLLNQIKEIEEMKDLNTQLISENFFLKNKLKENYGFDKIIGNSEPMKHLFENMQMVINSEMSVLINGETGTGKELVANAIHYHSPRKDRPLIKVNCAALPSNLIESELFGYEKGAFTGAYKQKKGRFELAEGGTLFLDEVDDIPLEIQVKLLRVLQENEIERVGGTRLIKIDVRIIAATKVDLKNKIKLKEFREDLYYRLSAFPLNIPPLRDRKDDIPLLLNSFKNKFCTNNMCRKKCFNNDILELLKSHSWKGNVRELEHVIERLVLICNHRELSINDLPSEIVNKVQLPNGSHPKVGFFEIIESIEKQLILDALKKCNQNKTHASELLHIKPSTFRDKLKKYSSPTNGNP